MKKLILVILLFVPFLGNTQDSNLGNWWIYYGNKQIKSKWNWHSEVQYRNYNFISDLEQLLLRTGFGYNLTENNNNILLGYGYILSENYIDGTDEKEDVHENRIYQQFITKQSFSRVSLQHRYRFEQRFIDDDFRLRFRYFLSINIALNHKEITDKTLYLSAYNEIFINTDDNIFDRNRIYAGLGYRFSKNIRIELGYMNQFLPESNRDQIMISSYVNF
jgi:hypothetical protein